MAARSATRRQREAYEAVERLGGTVAASNELGINIGSLCNLVKLYSERAGVPYPAGMQRRDGSGRNRTVLADVVGELELAVKAIQAAEERRDATLRELVDLIRELNARAPVLLVERYATHRRQSDGGQGGKAERSGR
jgi:hypothetical protein